MNRSNMQYASKAYTEVAKETAAPRELEARLLLKSAAKLQAVHDAWCEKPSGLADAVLYNRRLWIVFIDAVMRDDNKLPVTIRRNILNLGLFVMCETFSLMTRPRPDHLANLIRINRAIATGLRGKASKDQPQPTNRRSAVIASPMVA
jgi:flagellar biosynthesis activator protein FlaF